MASEELGEVNTVSVYSLILQQLQADGLTEIAEEVTTAFPGLRPMPLAKNNRGPLLEDFAEFILNETELKDTVIEAHSRVPQGIETSEFEEQPDLPLKEEFETEEELLEAAAVNLVRARQQRDPIFLHSPWQTKLFILLNGPVYVTFLYAVILMHMLLIFMEPPPMYYGLEEAGEDEQLRDLGYYPRSMRFIDFGCCLYFWLHNFAMVASEGGFRLILKKRARCFFLTLVTSALFFDAVAHVVNPGHFRPFRPVRPMLYILNNPVQTRMLKACMVTLKALVKTFVMVMVLLSMFAIVGLNMFSGHYDPEVNIFGAACLQGTNARHPFRNFGESWISMYTLATGDNHPFIVGPFMSCQCTFVPNNYTCDLDPSLYQVEPFMADSCEIRRYVAMAYFFAFLVLVFFGLGNIVLAVCYYHFEMTSQASLLAAAMKKRHSLLQSFYYIQDQGYVSKDVFLQLAKVARKMNLGVKHKGNEKFYFESLDTNGDGVLELHEYFHVVEMMQTRVRLGKNLKNPSANYARWKASSIRRSLNKMLDKGKWGLPYSDMIINFLIICNALFAAMESTRKDFQNTFADAVTVVFVVEVMIKIAALGARTYWYEFWNRFDLKITILSVLAFVGQQLAAQGIVSEDASSVLNIVSTARLMRLIRTITLIGRIMASADGSNYFQNVLTALASSIPACREMLMLIVFFLYMMANIGMELFGTTYTSSRNNNWDTGSINNVRGPDGINMKEYDFTTMGSAYLTCLGLLVGNTWSNMMYLLMDEYGFHATWFFICFHFLGIFLMLNVVQAVFVYAFSTFMDDHFFKTTWESLITQLDKKLEAVFAPKSVKRARKLDNLMLTQTQMSQTYAVWLAESAAPHLREMVTNIGQHYNEIHNLKIPVMSPMNSPSYKSESSKIENYQL